MRVQRAVKPRTVCNRAYAHACRNRKLLIWLAVALLVVVASIVAEQFGGVPRAAVEDINPRVEHEHPMIAWILKHGGHVGNVTLQPSPGSLSLNNGSDSTRAITEETWFATGVIAPGTAYLTVPSDLVISPSTAAHSKSTPVVLYIRSVFKSIAGSKLPGIELYVLLHFERFIAGNSSHWHPYLASLPPTFTKLPWYYPESDKELLESLPQGGSQFAAYFTSVRVVTGAIADVLAHKFPKLYGINSDTDKARLVRELQWAFCVVHSRALQNPDVTVPPYELVIIPGLDQIAHGSGDSTDALQFNHQGRTIVSVSQVAKSERHAGDQLRANYDVGVAPGERKCAVDFLLSYGFIPREAQYDCFYFRVKYTAFEGDTAAETARFAALQTIADDVKQIDNTTVELKFVYSSTTAADIVTCFSLILLRPFHFHEGRSWEDGTRQLATFSRQRVVKSLEHLVATMGVFFEAFIKGGNVTDNTFAVVYRLQGQSEKAAQRVLRELNGA